jgi:hypothetical protein
MATIILTLGCANLGIYEDIQAQSDLPEREEIQRSYQLSPGAQVEISTISGPVEIETTDSDKAEVYIVRSAQTRENFDCYRMAIEYTPTRLAIHPERDKRAICSSIRAHQRVKLKLPLRVNLKIETISGDVNIIQGEGYSEISEISGTLNMTVNRLSELGINVSGISGKVELRLGENLSADFDMDQLDNKVRLEMPKVTVSNSDTTSFRGRIGSGGNPISLSGINGVISIREVRSGDN